jgi:lysophospholipid acyltransferase 5
VHGADKFKNNLFLAASGCLIVIFNYGFDVYHSLLAIVGTYLLTNFMQNSPLLMPVAFCFHMGYLLIGNLILISRFQPSIDRFPIQLGYYFTSTDNYDICWTMPHCILALRLIGIAFDVADGAKPDDQLSADGKKLCLRRKPGLLEIAAFTYFPASVLVGPQFSFKRFNQFVEQEFDKYVSCLENLVENLKKKLCFFLISKETSSTD